MTDTPDVADAATESSTAPAESQTWSPNRAWTGKRHAGMPPIRKNRRAVSFFEFWPQWLVYWPLAPYITWLCLRNGGFTACSVADPTFPNGGVVGEEKSGVMKNFKGLARELVGDYLAWAPPEDGTLDPQAEAAKLLEAWRAQGQTLPVVVKPEIGCRGRGVRLVEREQDLVDYIAAFPKNAGFILQEFIDKEGEAGVFYIRYPGEEKGEIFSITLKYFPYVYGDGQSTLRQLIETDDRAGALKHIYLPRHADHLEDVPAEGQAVRLSFAGSHSGGTIFRDGGAHATEGMRAAFDRVADDIDGFYFGRFDVRFDDFEDLQNGRNFRILEINGASGEATHIWDSDNSVFAMYRDLARQYYHLWRIGGINKRAGHKPSSLWELRDAWRRETELMKSYPLMQ